jgi:hypothetical protein
LPGHAEGAGDLGLGAAGGKQRAGLYADAFERLAVTQTTGVAVVGGWSHTAMLPGQPPIMSSELAKLFFELSPSVLRPLADEISSKSVDEPLA